MAIRSHLQSVGEDRIRTSTGRSRAEWYAQLDDVGATAWDHARIARWLGGEREVDGWWAQSITVGYEQARGMRAPGQRPDGHFAAGSSKTLHAPVTRVWPYLGEEELRSEWLDGDWGLVRMTEPRALRLQADDGSRVLLTLVPVPPGRDGRPKCRLSATHARLPDAAAVAETKKFWTDCLARLAVVVER